MKECKNKANIKTHNLHWHLRWQYGFSLICIQFKMVGCDWCCWYYKDKGNKHSNVDDKTISNSLLLKQMQLVTIYARGQTIFLAMCTTWWWLANTSPPWLKQFKMLFNFIVMQLEPSNTHTHTHQFNSDHIYYRASGDDGKELQRTFPFFSFARI